MLPSLLLSLLTTALALVYPAYRNFKELERRNDVSDSDYRGADWYNRYWIIISVFMVVERLLDPLLRALIPLYLEAKLLFVIFLFHPRTDGATYIYEKVLRPQIERHEADVDRTLGRYGSVAVDMLGGLAKKGADFAQARLGEASSLLIQQAAQYQARLETERAKAAAQGVAASGAAGGAAAAGVKRHSRTPSGVNVNGSATAAAGGRKAD